MALFRRRSPGPSPVDALWAWWADHGRLAATRSINGDLPPEDFAAEMTARVRSVGGLGWELAAGETSEHVLVLTPEGNPELRPLARRVVLAAPEADDEWSYLDSRPPIPDPDSVVLDLGGARLDLARVQVSARMQGRRFDVSLHHPAFADLPDQARERAAFLALDAALGEVDTELWVGATHASEVPPLDSFGLMGLRSVVQDLKQRHLDEDGKPGWALLEGETPQGRLVAAAWAPLHPLTAPHLDTYVAVVLPYADHTGEGLPGEQSLQALRNLEERIGAALRPRGAVVAHQSVAGARTLHVYVDSTADLVGTVKHVARAWGEGKASVHDMRDPGWTAVTHLRG